MMRLLLLAAVVLAKQEYEECHLYRSAVIARERTPAPGRRRHDELRRDPVGVVSRIYAFLGVEAHATRPDLYARSMRKPLREYVENLDEVREALRGTPWAADPVLTA